MFFYTSKKLALTFIAVFAALLSFAQNKTAPATFWWNDAIFYEVFVRSFKDSDGDGKGDFKGLISKLDYLNDGDPNTNTDLGITAIWLMPIMQSPSYHGYDVIDYKTIEQDYGTNADFKKFMDEAHNRGIKVIIDFVMNHTSSQHPWFQASSDSTSAQRDWYIWKKTSPGNKGPWNQQVWYPKNGSNYYGIFWSEMPDLNYNTAAVKDSMFDIARFWMEDMNVDGFRLDAVKYIFEDGNTLEDLPATIDFWKDFSSYYKSVKPDAFAVGEAWTNTAKVAPYVNDSALDYCFEFDLASAILNAANYSSTATLKTQMDKVIAAYPHLQYGTFLTNHDMNRTMTQLGSNVGKAKVAANLLLTLPGVPYIYYGEEIGMTGSGADENKRTPLHWNNTAKSGFTTGTPWRAVNTDYSTKNIESQQVDQNSLWNEYQKLIALRNKEIALRRGSYKNITANTSSIVSFIRQYNNENILVVINTGISAVSDVALSLTNGEITAGTYKLNELFGGAASAVTINTSGGFTNLSLAQIPAQSTLIYKLENNTSTTLENQAQKIISTVYPIPSTNEIFIDYTPQTSDIVQYSICDVLGDIKTSSSFTASRSGGKQSISCENLSTGIYFLNVFWKEKKEIFKIIIQK
ncbi:MAG: alpha-amylase family glycosyl hydrolase [Bacteroidetes bacterium]|nr:alpha-amylase family glycosyl hydrolase [Bacteroidota bacterium]